MVSAPTRSNLGMAMLCVPRMRKVEALGDSLSTCVRVQSFLFWARQSAASKVHASRCAPIPPIQSSCKPACNRIFSMTTRSSVAGCLEFSATFFADPTKFSSP
eukprot:10095781-Alexandrium_andersonii.AAC.1